MALLIALICKQTPDRSEEFDLVVDIILALIGIVPIAFALLEVRESHAHRRPVTVTIEGDGKLGLVFAKGKVPLRIQRINPNGLAAQVRTSQDATAYNHYEQCVTRIHVCMRVPHV
eukprot:COSAG02_NODE_3910_length_6056_cov_3.352694_6_plen_116_part_00